MGAFLAGSLRAALHHEGQLTAQQMNASHGEAFFFAELFERTAGNERSLMSGGRG